MDPLLRLLIVDDESRFLQTIARRLRLRGLDVVTAGRGAEALDIARRQPLDLALLDLKMPGMDGTQVLRQLKEIDAEIEAVILTGHGSLSGAVDLSGLGAFAHLPKPYELDLLLATLAAAQTARLRRRHAQDPARLARLDALRQEPDPIKALRALREV